MDADGLPVVGPGVDYRKVPPIQQKRTLAFLNYFIIRTTSFLNHFASSCEEKLEDLFIRIQRLEASMCILEAKLASIPGLENITPETEAQTTPAVVSSNQETSNAPTVNASEVQNEPVPVAQGSGVPPAKPTEPSSVPERTVSKDPRFAKYFKMLNIGIPLGAVQQKMRSEGVDPNILDDPNAPAPAGSATVGSSDSEDSSFSD